MVTFSELFDLAEIQTLQDRFSDATGVASIITNIDGTPITTPSNFTFFCKDIIRKTEKGRENCFKSDAVLGCFNPQGPIVRQCLSGGLWDAGASITVDGNHVANWLIGQVRDETQTEESMICYAHEIGADVTIFMEAFNKVPCMSKKQFEKIAGMLFTLANQLSNSAYQNIQKEFYIKDLQQTQAMLKQSEEKFQMLFNQAPLGYQSLDINGFFIDVNQKWLDTLGYSYNEVIGKWFGDFLSPDYKEGFRARFPIFKAQGKIHSEFEMIHKNGTRLFIAFDGKIGYEQNGEFKQTHCILQDITERRRLEHELKESRHLIQSIIDNTTDAIYVKDTQGRYVLFNLAAEKTVGKSSLEVIGKDDYFIFPPHKAKIVMDDDRGVMKKSEIVTCEETLTDSEGRLTTFLTTKGPIYDEKNNQNGIFGIARNITERKLMENSLAYEKNRLETTLISVGDGVISCDNHGKVTFINRVAEELTGWSQSEANGEPIDRIFNIVDEFTGLPSENIVHKVLGSGMINELTNHTLLISRDGKKRPIEDSAAPIIQKNGEIIGVVLVFRDFTEKKQRQEEIEFLSFHDQLTKIYNRRYYEYELQRLDTVDNLPLSIIMGDVNGLKLINDSFGHAMGDLLLVKVAEIIIKYCRPGDIVARFGGDEFVVLLPRTNAVEAERIIKRIKKHAELEQVGTFNISISFGTKTKTNITKKTQDLLKETEDHMYKHKLSESLSMRSRTIDLIMSTLYEKNNREMVHSMRVSQFCVDIATKMNFNKDDINQIRIAGLMHDIGKIGIDENILNKPDKLTKEEWQAIERHSEIGYRILSSVNEFSEIAEFVLEHHEKWNGQGYPMGLSENKISLQARILNVADSYDAMTSERTYRASIAEEEGIAEIKRCAGTQFDPAIARIFVEDVLGRKWD